MSTIEKRIGGKVTEIRLEKKLTQAELAERIGISVESVSRLERGVSFPSLKTVDKISKTLDVSLKEFFDFDEHETRDKSYERELSKFVAFLRTLDEKEISLVHKMTRAAWKILRE